MIQQYSLAAFAFRRMWGMLVALAVLIFLLEQIFDRSTSSSVVKLLMYAIVALFAHRVILLDEKMSWMGKAGGAIQLMPFIGRYFGFVVVTAVVWGVAIYGQLQLPGVSSEQHMVVVGLFALAPAWLAFAILASLYGTVLPAAAIESDTSLSQARSRGAFFKTLWRLITGNLLSTFVLLALVVAIGPFVPDTMIALAVFSILSAMAGFFPMILTAATLSLAYMEADGQIPADA